MAFLDGVNDHWLKYVQRTGCVHWTVLFGNCTGIQNNIQEDSEIGDWMAFE